MAPEDWLVRLMQTDPKRAAVAARLVRMQILLQNRTEHVVLLGSEYLRRRVHHSAYMGTIASVVAMCERCRCQAKLAEWERSALLDADGRKYAIHQLYREERKWETAYIRGCPGAQYNADIMSLASDPAYAAKPTP